jgi:hypothetical protein
VILFCYFFTFSVLTNVSAAPNNGTEGSLYHLLNDGPKINMSIASKRAYEYGEYPANDEEYQQRVNSTMSDCICSMVTTVHYVKFACW